MRSIYCRSLVLFALLAGIALSLSAAESPKAKDDKRPEGPPAREGKPPPLEMPKGSILAVFDSLAEALLKSPHSVVMTREQYQAMKDELDRLRRLLDRPRLLPPARSQIKGAVEGDLVKLSVEFEVETREEDALVRLACGQAIATDARLDDHTPRLRTAATRASGRERPARPEDAVTDSDGFVVEIDKPGRHVVTLGLLLPVTSGSGGHGFTLDLPRTAVTRLELGLPEGARDVRLGGKPAAEALLERKNNQLSGNLGAAERLDLTWRPAQAATTSPTLTAEGVVTVQIGPKLVSTDARLTLSAQSGQVRQWRLLVPADAQLRVERPAAGENGSRPADEPKVEKASQNLLSLYTIHLKEPSAEPLTVSVEHTQPAPEPGGRRAAAIGPVVVLGATQHRGSVLVTNTVADWHLEFSTHGEVTRRAVTEEELRASPKLSAAFRYGPGGSRRSEDGKTGRLGGPSWLDIEVTAVGGQAKAQPAHTITLARDAGDSPCWQVKSQFTVTPRWADVDRFRVQMPEGCEYNPVSSQQTPEHVKATYDSKTRIVEFTQDPTGAGALPSFTVQVEATYPGDQVDERVPGEARLRLPRPTNAFEQRGKIVVEDPSLELLPPEPPFPGLDPVQQTTHKLEWTYPRRTPDQVLLRWRPYRPPVRVTSLANVTLLPGDVRVLHELRYQLPPEGGLPGGKLTLRVPPAITGLEVHKGGTLGPSSREPDGWQLASVSPSSDKDPTLVLSYHYPLANGHGGPTQEGKEAAIPTLSLPLVIPGQMASGETRVRIWCDAGQLPSATPGWTEQSIEVVPDQSRLPVLVLRSDRVDRPLAVRLGQGEPVLAALIERALVRVRVDANGAQLYRVSYRLSRLASRRLDLELPAPHLSINFEASLDGRRITPENVGGEAEGRLVGLRLAPELIQRPAVLEVSYVLNAHRLGGTALTTPLQAPRLAGDPARIPTRWQVSTPPGWVLLAPQGDLSAPRHWGWRGWLLAPVSGLTSGDLEHWFSGSEGAREEGALSAPDLVLWHDGFAPVQLVHVQQQPWLLLCSLGLVLLGLALSRLPLVTAAGQSSGWAWALLLGLLLVVGLLAILTPGLAGQLAYGCQPGVMVLVVLALVQWLRYERYRRQIIFLPSFSRSRTGSSMVRRQPEPEEVPNGAPQAPPAREPSTVDVPRLAGRPGSSATGGGATEGPGELFPRPATTPIPPGGRGPAGSST